MRELTDHQMSDLNKKITIKAADEIGAGNANHVYTMQVEGCDPQEVRFQHGAVKEVGLNGVSDECLITIVMDRLRGFQAGPFSCRENACALTKLEEAMHWLQHRTIDRMKRGVEGLSLK